MPDFFYSSNNVQFCSLSHSMLTIDGISFSYTDKIVVDAVSFSIEKGITLAVIGESGCGKSTLLKLIYGLYDLDEGQIFWNDTKVLGPKYNLIPGMDFMKFLAQDFDLMPYITVAENVGKFLSNINPEKKKKRIAELLELVEMEDFSNTRAQFLSGGQMQRVAIARVLALEPEVVLLDEPFSHIDNFRKNSLRRKVFSYLKQKRITCIIATHDSKDILGYTDETLVIRDGKLIAHNTTTAVYKKPENVYIASLYDDVNEIPATVLGIPAEPEKKIIVYPFQLKVVPVSDFEVMVIRSYFKGNGYLVEAAFQNRSVFFESESTLEKNSTVCLAYRE